MKSFKKAGPLIKFVVCFLYCWQDFSAYLSNIIKKNPFLIRNTFLDELKNETLRQKKFENNMEFWTGTLRQLNMFLNKINCLNKSIQFTVEKEAKNCLKFLELSIYQDLEKLNFNVFWNLTYTDVIPADSYHACHTKCSAFNSMIYVLFSSRLSLEDSSKELQSIEIAYSQSVQPVDRDPWFGRSRDQSRKQIFFRFQKIQ